MSSPTKPPNQTKELKKKKSQTETLETKLTGFRYHKGLPYLET